MITADDEVSLAYLLEPTFQIENTEGRPLTEGWIEVYIHGTRTKYYCYSDWNGSLHPFKIPLDSLGANIVLASPAHSYDLYIYNKYGTLVMSRYNIIPSTGDGAVIKDVVTIKSEDGTVNIVSQDQTNWNLSIKDTVDRVEQNEQEISNVKVDIENVTNNITNLTEVVNNHTTEIGQIKEDVAGIESSLLNKKDKQPTKSFNGSATKTIKNISQNANGELTVEFEDIDLPQEVPNVEITSEDNSIKVTETTDVVTNTKKFDLSVNVEDPLEYGQFRATNVTSQALLNKVQGNIELNNYSIKLKKGNSYHFTVRGSYVATNATNTATTIHYIEYSSFTPIQVNVDNTITDAQFFEISYDVYKLSSDKNYNVSFSSIDGGKVSELWVEVHNLNGVSVNGQGGGLYNETVLWSGNERSGDFKLSESYKNFEKISITHGCTYGYDNRGMSPDTIIDVDTFELYKCAQFLVTDMQRSDLIPTDLSGTKLIYQGYVQVIAVDDTTFNISKCMVTFNNYIYAQGNNYSTVTGRCKLEDSRNYYKIVGINRIANN